MNTIRKAARGCKPSGRRKKIVEPHRSHVRASVNPSLTDEFAKSTRRVERLFVAAAWLDPIAGWNAGVRAGLQGASFAFLEYSALYRYCCLSIEIGFRPSIKQAVALLRTVGIALAGYANLDEIELYRLIMDTPVHRSQTDLYAFRVVYCARKRSQASRLLRRATEVFTGDVIASSLKGRGLSRAC